MTVQQDITTPHGIDIQESRLKIFRKGSRTFFYSSLFFPKDVRRDIFTLYSFTRLADDFVDSIPQQPDAFAAFRAQYEEALRGKKVEEEIVQSFADLSRDRRFDEAWVEAFFRAMESDLGTVAYQTVEDLKRYIYGAAEVIGLMSHQLTGVPKDTEPAAQSLGRAFQYINFIRDIQEDLDMHRQYLPIEELEAVGLKDLSEASARERPDAFIRFMRLQFERYRDWQREGEEGLHKLPTRIRVPLLTAAQMYWWTAEQIESDPWIVYRKKVKPGIGRILLTATRHATRPPLQHSRP